MGEGVDEIPQAGADIEGRDDIPLSERESLPDSDLGNNIRSDQIPEPERVNEVYTITFTPLATSPTPEPVPHPYAGALRDFFTGGPQNERSQYAVKTDINGDGVEEVFATIKWREEWGEPYSESRFFFMHNGNMRTHKWDPMGYYWEVHISTKGYLVGTFFYDGMDGGTEHIIYSLSNGELRESTRFDTWSYSQDAFYNLLMQYGIDYGAMHDSPTDQTTQILAMTTAPPPMMVSPISLRIFVNGQPREIEAYTINDSNYIRLRDFALIISRTDKQFELVLEPETGVITFYVGMPYTPVGAGSQRGDGKPQEAIANEWLIDADGEEWIITAYNFGGSNFFALRDLLRALDINLSRDASNTLSIDTSVPYSP